MNVRDRRDCDRLESLSHAELPAWVKDRAHGARTNPSLAPAAVDNSTDVLTIAEAAALLRVSERTVFRMIADGRIEFFRVGRSVRIPRDKLPGLGWGK